MVFETARSAMSRSLVNATVRFSVSSADCTASPAICQPAGRSVSSTVQVVPLASNGSSGWASVPAPAASVVIVAVVE